MKNNILILLIADTFLLYSKFLAKNDFLMFVDLGCFSFILFSEKKFGINRFRWGDILYIMFAYLILFGILI